MPNRIIKDTLRTSKNVNLLTDFQFRVWVYLITYVDDYGRGSADPELLKGLVFTRRRGVTEQQISKALADLANAGMITLYEVDGESYLYFPNWDKHQRMQTKKSKFPAPDNATRCSTVNHGESPPESNPNPNPNPNPESESEDSTERQAASAPPVCLLPLNTGKEYAITAAQVEEWGKLYPAVDIMQALNAMRGWCLANPTKRKTARGILSFVNRWLAKEQDQGGTKSKPESLPKNDKTIDTSNPFLRMLMEMEGENGQN